MDDRKVYALARLKLAYKKQLLFMAGFALLCIMGIVLYIITVYRYHFGLMIIALVMIISGIIGVMTIDQKMKVISEKIREL